ncbi:MAG: hypothetical protein HYU39_00640 [Thaumarchaeota archaeon]|nr:hypothetical protein [Nitrososphaerota archaeon]
MEKLAKKLRARRSTSAHRDAVKGAGKETENFKGDVQAIAEALRFAKPVAKKVSEKVDEELARSIK